jgi:hypothetical protein
MSPRIVSACLLAAGALMGCDQISLGPRAADSAPPVVAPPAPRIDLRPFAGATYPDFAARAEAPAPLDLSATDEARLTAAMAAPQPSWIARGGGAEALLFTGCAAEGCAAGRAVVAFDLATGAAFVGVRDAAGATELAPNPRLEALLRLSSPDRDWDDPRPPEPAAAP